MRGKKILTGEKPLRFMEFLALTRHESSYIFHGRFDPHLSVVNGLALPVSLCDSPHKGYLAYLNDEENLGRDSDSSSLAVIEVAP